MLVDARSFPEGQVITKTDVCVVGAGPCRAHARSRTQGPGSCGSACSSEGTAPGRGGRRRPRRRGHRRLSAARDDARAGVGGTAALWTSEIARTRRGARLGRLQPVDFEQRPDVPFSGSPFDRAELDPHYGPHGKRGGTAVGRPAGVAGHAADRSLPLGEEIVTQIVHCWPESTFTRDLPESARRSDDVTLVVNARALRIEAERGAGRARRVLAASAPGRTFEVEARLFVLALGGIENARLLLLSERRSRFGLGNRHDIMRDGSSWIIRPRAAVSSRPGRRPSRSLRSTTPRLPAGRGRPGDARPGRRDGPA